jgi:hypothetical protein
MAVPEASPEATGDMSEDTASVYSFEGIELEDDPAGVLEAVESWSNG